MIFCVKNLFLTWPNKIIAFPQGKNYQTKPEETYGNYSQMFNAKDSSMNGTWNTYL